MYLHSGKREDRLFFSPSVYIKSHSLPPRISLQEPEAEPKTEVRLHILKIVLCYHLCIQLKITRQKILYEILGQPLLC